MIATLLAGNEDMRPHAELDQEEIRSASAEHSVWPCVHAAARGLMERHPGARIGQRSRTPDT